MLEYIPYTINLAFCRLFQRICLEKIGKGFKAFFIPSQSKKAIS